MERTAKRIVRIKVSGGQVFVTAHKSLSLAEIKEIVESRREWINAAAGVAADSLPEKEERSGASAADMADMFCGRKCLICGETLEVKSTTGSKGYVDGGTVYDKELFRLLRDTAQRHQIPWQVKHLIAGGNDSRAVQRTKNGVRVAGISAAVRYLHAPASVGNMQDFEHMLALTAAFVDALAAQC